MLPNKEQKRGNSENRRCKKPLILVVDDEPMNIEVTKAIFESQGYECDTAMSGKEALALFDRRIQLLLKGKVEMYRLALLDFSMPVMDGP